MKIGIDAINLRGGGIIHLKNLLKYYNFNKNKTKIVIWCNDEVKKSIHKHKYIIIKNYKIFSYNLIIRSLWAYFFFSRDIYKNSCEAVLCLNGINVKNFKSNFVFFQNVLPLEKKIRLYDFLFNKKLKYFLQYIMFKNSYKISKANIFPSIYSKNLFEKEFGKNKKNFVVHHGISKNKKINFSNNSNILCITSLEPFKNVKNLIKATKILSDKNIKYKLKIVGPGNKNQKLEIFKFINELKLKNRVKYLGELNNKKLKKILSNSRILVNPSMCESFGLPNLEGYVSGSNIVCSNLPVFKEILKNYPFYFNEKSSVSIANQLIKALKEKRVSIKNIQDIQKKFDWVKTSLNTFNILNYAKK